MSLPNIGEAGSWLEVCHQGEYQSFVTLSWVEAKSENWRIEVELLDLESSIELNIEANIYKNDTQVYYYYGMDVPILSLFLRPILTVFFSKTGETGDIY